MKESWQKRLNHWKRMAQKAGARIGNHINDLDLHIACPNGETINFTNKFTCDRMLDIDRNAQANSRVAGPVENIVSTRTPTVNGTYDIYVHYCRRFDEKSALSTFDVRLQKTGKTTFHNGQLCKHVASFVI